jgi:hypothetical protein
MDDRCAQCGFDGSALDPGDVARRLRTVPVAVAASARACSPPLLRSHPDDATWSVIEYVGHLGDAMAYHQWVIGRALTEDRVVVDGADPDAAVAQAAYQDADLDVLVQRFEHRVGRLATVLETLEPAVVDRRVSVSGATVSISFLARSALHEALHHAADIDALRARPETTGTHPG